MRENDDQAQSGMCSYGSREALVPDHPLCAFRKLAVLARVQTAAGLLPDEHFTVDGTLREVA